MAKVRVPLLLILAFGVIGWAAGPIGAAGERERNAIERIFLEDDCDTDDPTWDNADGSEGCLLKRGTVTRAEFNFYSLWRPPSGMTPPGPPQGTPLANAVIGHPSWRIDPGYLTVKEGTRLRVLNTGGRGHTFTPVASFGGGFVPPISFGLAPAPECLAVAPDPSNVIEPGSRALVTELAPGANHFQCCIHPWMRALVKVEPKHD
jgi:hypothetical protein